MAPSIKAENFSRSEKIMEQEQNGDKTRGTKKKGFGNNSETLVFTGSPGRTAVRTLPRRSILKENVIESKRCVCDLLNLDP
jgi:hypothetical protein